MYFDKFDICDAYYWFAVQYAGLRTANRYQARLARLGYKPSAGVEYGRLEENAQAIFEALEEREGGDILGKY